jgi:Insecticide toxin TcdB middle/C-terminal region/HD domain
LPQTPDSRRIKRDALRALRGSVLRTELYALDGSPREHRPYTVSESNYGLVEMNMARDFDDQMSHVWGKARPAQDAVHPWHPLAYHCLDVDAGGRELMISWASVGGSMEPFPRKGERGRDSLFHRNLTPRSPQ